MTLSNFSLLRIHNQEIENQRFISPQELVAHMGAMQAQDYLMAKWAVGLRLQQATDSTIVDAYNSGKIIRTHLMRPTWHFVSSNDVYWLLELTAPQIKKLSKSRNKQLELDENLFRKSNAILEKNLANCVSLTRENLTQLYLNANIRTDDNRLSHLLMQAELDGLICNGEIKGNKLTYALLEEKVPVKKLLSRDESLAELANRYFTSHAPATMRDFIWWSGLSVTDARKAMEMNKPSFISETFDDETYWFIDTLYENCCNLSVYLLPAFDELLIGYRNRTAIINENLNKKAISENGIFRPIIVVNGQVVGIWKRATQKTKVVIEVNLFSSVNVEIKTGIEQEVRKQALFMEKEMQLVLK
jgi:hypothetical protein